MAGPPKSVVSIVQPKRVSFRVALSGGSIRLWPTVSPPPLPGAAFSDRGHSFYTSALPPE